MENTFLKCFPYIFHESLVRAIAFDAYIFDYTILFQMALPFVCTGAQACGRERQGGTENTFPVFLHRESALITIIRFFIVRCETFQE